MSIAEMLTSNDVEIVNQGIILLFNNGFEEWCDARRAYFTLSDRRIIYRLHRFKESSNSIRISQDLYPFGWISCDNWYILRVSFVTIVKLFENETSSFN